MSLWQFRTFSISSLSHCVNFSLHLSVRIVKEEEDDEMQDLDDEMDEDDEAMSGVTKTSKRSGVSASAKSLGIRRTVKKVPKGVSEYQAAWIVDAESEDEEVDSDEAMSKTCTL